MCAHRRFELFTHGHTDTNPNRSVNSIQDSAIGLVGNNVLSFNIIPVVKRSYRLKVELAEIPPAFIVRDALVLKALVTP